MSALYTHFSLNERIDAHSLYVVVGVQRKTVIDALGQYNHISLVHLDSDPSVLSIPYIKVPRTLEDISDFLRGVNVLLVKVFELQRYASGLISGISGSSRTSRSASFGLFPWQSRAPLLLTLVS